MNTLFLRLEGPLQAWGLRARWGERDTASAPTKSGVIGLLGCALGLLRDDDARRHLAESLRMGVRIDRPGTLLRDYHTTGGGSYAGRKHSGGTLYHDSPYVGGVLSAEVKKGRILVKRNETTKEPETDTSNRYYLADASFRVALQGDSALIEQLAESVQNPQWPYYLGRKACVPSTAVFDGVGEYPDLAAALQVEWPDRAPHRVLLEALPGQGNRQFDNILGAAKRVFGPRFVAERWFDPPVEYQDDTRIDTLEG